MIGRLVLHYRILAELGQGGMGQVFRARDERLGREVALKMLPAELAGDSDFQVRFMREARAASSLNHPGIVTLNDLQSFEARLSSSWSWSRATRSRSSSLAVSSGSARALRCRTVRLRCYLILPLAACAATTPTAPSRPGRAPAEVTAEQTPPPAGEVPTDETPTPDGATPDPAPVQPPVTPGEPGTATHCLHVGPERRVVQCYWKREDCDAQIAFNRESGVTRPQECSGYAKAFCTLPSNSSEMCFPTTEDCDRTVANMLKRNRQATACVAKTGP